MRASRGSIAEGEKRRFMADGTGSRGETDFNKIFLFLEGRSQLLGEKDGDDPQSGSTHCMHAKLSQKVLSGNFP